MARYRTIPARWIRVERTKGTTGTRSRRTGQMTGRKPGRSDGTQTRRLIHDVDLDHDGIDDYKSGQILGRTSRNVKASNRARSYTKQI